MKTLNCVLSVCFLSLFLGSCKNKPCSNFDGAFTAVSGMLATTLSCSNSAAIKTDLYAFAETKGICQADARGPIASMVCPVVVQWVVGFGVGKIPATWGCTGAASEAALSVACNAIPF